MLEERGRHTLDRVDVAPEQPTDLAVQPSRRRVRPAVLVAPDPLSI